MTYIDTKHKDTLLVPGQPLGDAKTFETRGVPIEVDSSTGYPVENLQKGSVVYIDNRGYAVPFTTPDEDHENDAKPVPYGVVYLVDAKTQTDRPQDITPHSNEVKVVVEGVVAVKMLAAQTQTAPHTGQMVNPYGGAMTVTGSGPAMQPLGICDGIQKRGDDVYVAVRLTPGSGVHSNELHSPRFVLCKNMGDGKIGRYDAVYLKGEQPVRTPDYIPQVGRIDPEDADSTNNNIFGFAWPEDEVEKGSTFQVLYFGVGYFPYITQGNPAVAKLIAANGGKVPKRFPAHIKLTDGGTKNILPFLATVVPLLATLVSAGCEVYRTVKNSNAPAKVVDVVESDTAKYRELLRAEGDGVWDVEPDGYLGLFVNPGLNSPTPITGQAALLESERKKGENLLIREGKCYVGSVEGVRPYDDERDTPESVSFYGVATEPLAEDAEASANLSDLPDYVVRCVRDGLVNLRPNMLISDPPNWHRGDFIAITGKPIPPADEEFVPHIGKAMEDVDFSDNANGERSGLIDIRPFNPNQYISVEHCKVAQDMKTLTSVFVKPAGTTEGGFATADVGFAGSNADHVYEGVTGVIVRVEPHFYGDGEYDGRAVVQISGYVRCKMDSDVPLAAGAKVKHMIEGYIAVIDSEDPTEPGYMNILGTLLRTDTSADGSDPHWFVALAPRTQYVAPIETSKKV